MLCCAVENHRGESGGLRNPMLYSIAHCGRCRQPMVTQTSFILHLIKHLQGVAQNLIGHFKQTI